MAAVLLHLSLLVQITMQAGQKEKAKKQGDAVEVRLFMSAELLPKVETTLDPNALHVDCPKTYEGIGIKRNPMNKIVEVAPGWPADKAGIQVGDYTDLPWDDEKPNGFMEFNVTRNGKTVHMKLRTEKICYRDEPF